MAQWILVSLPTLRLVLLTVEAAISVPPLLIFLSFLGFSALFTALAVIVPFVGRRGD